MAWMFIWSNLGTVDTLMMNVVFYAGNCFETQNLVAPATNFMLKNGTRTKTAYQINEYFEYYGAYLNRQAGHETAELTLHCMKKNFAELLAGGFRTHCRIRISGGRTGDL